MNIKPRRQLAYVNSTGTTQMHLRHPLIIAWWSAAFPGFGHLLLSKFLRGFLLIGWEMFINTKAHINLAMFYTFSGQFNKAAEVLDVRWMSLYAPVYLYAIYDSYRTTVDLNHMYVLAKRENAYFPPFVIDFIEINYLDKRSPRIALLWSLLMPGMGQLYIHRIITAFFALCVWIGIVYQSHFLEGLQYTLLMDFTKATDVVDKQWILFLPSIYGFTLYDAYTNTVENNKLFDREQKNYLNANFQNNQFAFPYYQPAEIEGETMHVISSFDHSIYVELVITALIEEGIPNNNIFSVSLDKRKEKPKMFDNIHQSDGISLFDTGAACATALAVIGSTYGFVLKGGPILWGCIGAIVGFLIGFVIDLLVKRKNPNNQTKGKMSEVVILVDCRKEQVDMVESILWKHLAFGVAKVGG
jgi:TM2 domain-containing membrane protein YozV